MQKSVFQEHRDDVAKVCKRLLGVEESKRSSGNLMIALTEGKKHILKKVIWMLECDYPSELYERYSEFLDDAEEEESQDEDVT